jgi:hypothetical protein
MGLFETTVCIQLAFRDLEHHNRCSFGQCVEKTSSGIHDQLVNGSIRRSKQIGNALCDSLQNSRKVRWERGSHRTPAALPWAPKPHWLIVKILKLMDASITATKENSP